jgi:hypothetical protein
MGAELSGGVRYGILGPLAVIAHSGPLRIGSQLQRVLLAVLLVDANRPVAADRLACELWGDDLPRDPMSALRTQVSISAAMRSAKRQVAAACRSGASPFVVRVNRHDQETIMRYVMLICTDETAEAAVSHEEMAVVMADYGAFGEEMGSRGVLQGGERLRPTTDATTVRVREGEVLTSDGPFAETKEQIGGYYVVDCQDLDEAIEVASKIPGARNGSIEVRPIWEM